MVAQAYIHILVSFHTQVDLKISPELVAEWQGSPMRTKEGIVKCKSLSGAPIK